MLAHGIGLHKDCKGRLIRLVCCHIGDRHAVWIGKAGIALLVFAVHYCGNFRDTNHVVSQRSIMYAQKGAGRKVLFDTRFVGCEGNDFASSGVEHRRRFMLRSEVFYRFNYKSAHGEFIPHYLIVRVGNLNIKGFGYGIYRSGLQGYEVLIIEKTGWELAGEALDPVLLVISVYVTFLQQGSIKHVDLAVLVKIAAGGSSTICG